MTNMTDTDQIAQLIARARERDRSSFDRLASEYRGRLTSIVESRLGVQLRLRLEVEDVVQETFTRAFRAIADFRGRDGATLLSWLRTTAEHVILENARAQSRLRTLKLDREVAENGVSASRGLRRNERFERLEGALRGLSADHRRVVVLARIDGLTIKEISKRMDRSPDAIKQLLSRALKKLREEFGDTGSLHLPDRRLDAEQHGGTGS